MAFILRGPIFQKSEQTQLFFLRHFVQKIRDKQLFSFLVGASFDVFHAVHQIPIVDVGKVKYVDYHHT
jgi:hypothetical protein